MNCKSFAITKCVCFTVTCLLGIAVNKRRYRDAVNLGPPDESSDALVHKCMKGVD